MAKFSIKELKKQIKALIAVHLFGFACKIDLLKKNLQKKIKLN